MVNVRRDFSVVTKPATWYGSDIIEQFMWTDHVSQNENLKNETQSVCEKNVDDLNDYWDKIYIFNFENSFLDFLQEHFRFSILTLVHF